MGNWQRIIGVTVAVALITVSSTAHAQAVAIAPLTGQRAINSDFVQNMTGSCGSAVVRVLGVSSVNSDMFGIDLDSGQVIVRNRAASPDEIIVKDFLSDHNGVACVGPTGFESLLLWSVCGGTACGDDFSFMVINPRRMVVVAGGDRDEPCDARCAASVTSSVVPLRLNGLLD